MKKNLKVIKRAIIYCNLLIVFISFILSAPVQAISYNNEITNSDIVVERMINESNSTSSTYSLLQDIPEISGKTYYIKNAFTGQYLDIQGGVAADGTNVRQYKFNGTDSQKWYIHSWGDGNYSILTPLGNDGSFKYALDINGGYSADGTNAQIWGWNASDAQKFSIGETISRTYVIFTKCSNYDKILTLEGYNCSETNSAIQDERTYLTYLDCWILEPVSRNDDFGIKYARANYQQYVQAYPNLTTFNGSTADCANFVSQCLLASGKHYDGNWKIYRKDINITQPTTAAELDSTWELCQPNTSPWVSAKEFGDYWRTKTTPEAYTVNYILNNPDTIFNKDYFTGDVFQIAVNRLGFLAESYHTMYVTSYSTYNGHQSFALTYHSNSQVDKNLLEICQAYQNNGQNPYIVFFSI